MEKGLRGKGGRIRSSPCPSKRALIHLGRREQNCRQDAGLHEKMDKKARYIKGIGGGRER